MNFTKLFTQISKNDTAIAGGKGASLGEMTQAGIPVPDGFVILSSAFENFLEETDLNVEIDSILHSVNIKEMHTIENASEKIKDLILKAKMPKDISEEIKKEFKNLNAEFVAVRSSATAEDSSSAAWAGQLDTFLNTAEKTLLVNVQKCWASLFTPRAIFYRFEKGLHKTKISVAVVIQKMVNSEKSGIAFSVHPVTQDQNQLIIEAGYGLGEAIVSGSVTPNSYVVEKEPRRIIDKNITNQGRGLYRNPNGGNEWQNITEEMGNKSVLSDEHIGQLSDVILKIEKHYGFPIDIEWAYRKNKFYVVQSRPITTLSNIEKTIVDVKKKKFIDSLKKSKKWVPVVERHICLLIRDLILSGEKSAVFNEALGIDIAPIGDAIVRDHVFSPIESIENTNYAIQLLVNKHGYKKLMEIARACLERAKELHQYLESNENIELTDRLKNFKKLYTRVTCYLLIVVFSEKFLEKQVENLIKEKTGEENKRYFESIVYVRKFNQNTEELVAILELSKLIKTKELDINSEAVTKLLKKHAEEYGWLGTRWQFENSWDVEDIKLRVKRYLDGNPEKQLSDVLQPREEAEIATKEFIQKFNLNTDEKEFIDFVKEFVFLRTFRTESLARANYLVKPFLQEASEILRVDRGDIVFLSVDEIIDSINKRIEYTKIIKQRKNGDYMILCDDVIEIFTEDERLLVDELNIFNFGIGEGDKITGQIAWLGIAKGKVKIVKDQKDILKVKDGDILVVVMTFPNYIPAMEKASAFVTDEGGILCHAAIVSREMKKPCIIGTKVATSILHDGDLVEVDADNGVVRILERAEVKKNETQSRPITTLTPTISKAQLYDESKNWIHYLTRPFSLFGASIWHLWYSSSHTEKLFGIDMPDVLFIEEHLNVVRQYRNKEQLNVFKNITKKIVIENPEASIKILKKGLNLNKQAEKYLRVGKGAFPDLQSALDFLINIALHSTIFPYFAYVFLDELNIKNKEISDISKKLRSVSYYQKLLTDIVIPIAKEKLKKHDQFYENFLDLLTISELLDGNVKQLNSRLEARHNNQRFIYQILNGQESVLWTNKVLDIILKLENIPGIILKDGLRQINGQVAFPGKIKGIARIVLTSDGKGAHFNIGDILVSINSNPNLMPLIQKSVAIITDEGGVMCHAAIISRELKKPCITGTKVATSILHDGDLVEVDADKGVVRILERAEVKKNETQSRPITTLGHEDFKAIRSTLFNSARALIKKYDIHPPFIHKGFHAKFYSIDFVQLIWNKWGEYSDFYYKLHISALHNDYWDLYYFPEEFTALRNHYFAHIENDKNYLQKHYQDWQESCRRLQEKISSLDSAITKNDFLKLEIVYKDFVEEYIFEYALAAPIQEACGFQPEQWIIPEIEEYVKKYSLDYHETVALLTSPIVLSFITEEEISHLQIALKSKTFNVDELIKKHQEKYFWVQNNYADIQILGIDFFSEKVSKAAKLPTPEIEKKIHELKDAPTKTQLKKEYLFEKHCPSSLLKKYVEIVEKFAEMQDIRKSFVLRANYYHKLFLERVGQEFSQSFDNLWLYSWGELVKAISSKIFLSDLDIEKRKEMIVAVESKNEKVILSGGEANFFYNQLQEYVSKVTMFSGLVAQVGKVQGKVKIVLKSEDIGKVSEGDILVSSMTRPEMTLSMKKAAAFITDEGGITSHAAIIARELRKPCIIGTKIATQILHDGDLVEVDADNGVVRIIKLC